MLILARVSRRRAPVDQLIELGPNRSRNGGEQASNMPKIASQSSEAPRDTEGGCLFANMFAEILSDPGVQKNMDVLRNRQPGKDGLSYSANSANVGGNADAGHKAP